MLTGLNILLRFVVFRALIMFSIPVLLLVSHDTVVAKKYTAELRPKNSDTSFRGGFTVKPVICQLAISNIIMVFTYRTHQADVMVKKQKQAFPHFGFVYCTCSRIRLPRITLYRHVSVMKFYNEVFTSPEIPLRRRKPGYVFLQKTQFSHNEFIHKTPDFQKL